MFRDSAGRAMGFFGYDASANGLHGLVRVYHWMIIPPVMLNQATVKEEF